MSYGSKPLSLNLSEGMNRAAPSPRSPRSPMLEGQQVPIYRRHSRKRSSQVFIPPIQARRRSSSNTSEGEEGTSSFDRVAAHDELYDENGNVVDKLQTGVDARTVASGATFLIGAQFFAKMITFSLNQALLRFTDPELLGANAQLDLLVNTILFYSREAVRLATQRQTLVGKTGDVYRFEGGVVEGTRSGTAQQVINMGFVPLVIGILLATGTAVLYNWNQNLSNDRPYVGTAVIIIAVSSVVELLSEPSFVLGQLQLKFKNRAKFESVSIVARCLLTFMFVVMARRSGSAIIGFALGQLAYSTILSGLYIAEAFRTSRHEQYRVSLPQGVWKENVGSAGNQQTKVYFDKSTKHLALTLWGQNFFKHLLSEGDRLLVWSLLTLEEQGVYALVVNYGSLVARLVFLPIEEALRNFFSKLFTNSSVEPTDAVLSVTVLSTLLRLYAYLSLAAVIFGSSWAPFILRLVVSPSWLETDAPRVLATYAVYIPFLAYNGALEAFVQSVATPHEIKRQSYVMVGMTLSFMVAAYVLMSPRALNLGPRGLVYANMVNMALRILWCGRWIERFYSHNTEIATVGEWEWLRKSVPATLVLSVAAVAASIAQYRGPVDNWSDFSEQAALAGLLVVAIGWSEKELIFSALARLRRSSVTASTTPSSSSTKSTTTSGGPPSPKSDSASPLASPVAGSVPEPIAEDIEEEKKKKKKKKKQ